MWHEIPPWLDKILAILLYILKTLGRLGRIKRSEFIPRAEFEDRNDSWSAIHVYLLATKACMVAGRVSRYH